MEIGTHHFTWGLMPQVWHGCLHGNPLRRWGAWILLRVEFDSTLNTCPTPCLQKCCHVGIHVILETWNPMWSGESQFSCSQHIRLHELTSSDLELKTWEPHVNWPKDYNVMNKCVPFLLTIQYMNIFCHQRFTFHPPYVWRLTNLSLIQLWHSNSLISNKHLTKRAKMLSIYPCFLRKLMLYYYYYT